MVLAFAILSVILSVILLYFNRRLYPSSTYLSLFFLLVSVFVFNVYVVFYSRSVFLVSLFYLNIAFLSYLTGPVFYWYIRSVLTDNSRLKKGDIWHFMPMLVFFLATLPYLFSSWSHKVDTATRIVDDAFYLAAIKPNLFYHVLPVFAIYLSRPLLIFAYVVWSLALFVRYRVANRKAGMFSGQHQFMDKWLVFLFCFVLVLVVTHAVTVLEAYLSLSFQLFYTLNILQGLSAAGLFGLLVSPFFFPYILYGLPRLVDTPPTTALPVPAPGTITGNRKGTPDFEADYLCSIGRQVESLMEARKPYLEPDCNLNSFSKLLDIPAHHVAYYFREVRKQTFNDFKNGWRVSYAKKLIQEGKNNEITLEAIGLLSGFSSKNTFFSAFKKEEGITPGAYASKNLHCQAGKFSPDFKNQD